MLTTLKVCIKEASYYIDNIIALNVLKHIIKNKLDMCPEMLCSFYRFLPMLVLFSKLTKRFLFQEYFNQLQYNFA